MTLSDEQILRQKGYILSLLALDRLHKNGVLTDGEFRKATSIIEDKYKPYIVFNS